LNFEVAEIPSRRNQSDMESQPPSPIYHRHIPKSTLGGRLFLIAIGLSLVVVGSLFILLMGRSFLRAKAMRTWPQIPCVILTSEVEERRNDPDSAAEFRHLIRYGYEYRSRPYIADHLTLRGSPWSSRKAELEAKIASYPAGKTTICYVDPAHPEFAVLKPDSLAPGYAIWFPALFVVGGLGIAIQATLKFSAKNQH
jgi:Protein of unknown function (DUF3592)